MLQKLLWTGGVLVVLFVALLVVAAFRLRADRKRLAAKPLAVALEEIRQEHGVPALGVGLMVDGKLVELEVVGVRAVGLPEKVTREDLWHLGSCGKAMTATVAASLVQSGKVRWESTVGEMLPDAAVHEGWKRVTLQQLLEHRGGAPADAPADVWQQAWETTAAPREARAEFARAVLSKAPALRPGEKFVYSNTGYALVGYLLEQAAQQPWEELLQTRLWQPLGVASAGFGAPGKVGVVDQPRGHTGTRPKLQAMEPNRAADNPAAIAAAGTLHMTLTDFLRFGSLHALGEQRGGAGIGAEMFRRLHTAPAGGEYAAGWLVTERSWAGGPALTHTGSNTFWAATVWLAPKKGAALCAVANSYDGGLEACDAAISLLIDRQLDPILRARK